MQTSQVGRDFIAREEGGHQLTAYQDQVGIWTIGVGHTGPEVKRGLTIAREQSEALFKLDLARFEAAVTKALAGGPALHQYEFDALVSLAFNIGAGAFAGSTLAKKLRAGDFLGAAQQFAVWNKAGGQANVLLGRRIRETLLFTGYWAEGGRR
jgi:lysozyme